MSDSSTSYQTRVAVNSMWNFAGWAIVLIISFVASPILIRLLGEDRYGLMVLLLSILTPLGLLDFGIGEATIKYIAESLGKNDQVQVEKYFHSTFSFNLIIGVVGGLLIVFSAPLLSSRVFNIPAQDQEIARLCLYWIGISWCINQIRQTFIGAISALQRYEIVSLGTSVNQAGNLLAGIFALVLGGNLLTLVQIQTAFGALTLSGWFLFTRQLYPRMRIVPRLDPLSFKRTFSFGFWQMLNSLGGLLAHESERWLLGILLPLLTVGFYNLGIQLNSIVYLVSLKLGQVLFPAISQLQGQGEEKQAARLTVQASWLVTSVSIALFVPLIVFASDILRLWIGPNIAEEATDLVRILAIGNGIGSLFAVPNFYLLGTGRSLWLAVMSFAQGTITFIVSLVLIPRIGLLGAGWGLTAGTVVHVTVLLLMWFHIFRAWIPAAVYLSATFSQYVVGSLLALAFLNVYDRLTWTPGWLWLGIAGAFTAVISWLVILAVDGFLPGGISRRNGMVRLAMTMIFPKLAKLLKIRQPAPQHKG